MVECDFVVDCQCVDWCVCQHLQELEQDLLQEETQLPVFFARETQELMSVYDDISKSVIANSAGSAAEGDDVHLFVRLSVCLSVAKMQKMRFSQKLSNLKLWCLLTTYRKLCKLNSRGFSKNPLLDSYNPKWLRYAILKIDMTLLF